MNKILLPIDFSIHTRRICNFALQLAEDLDASIHLFHVCRSIHPTDLPLSKESSSFLFSNSSSKTRASQEATEKLSLIKESMLRQGGNIRIFDEEIIRGKTEEEIIYASNRIQPDLIVMGTRGTSKVYKTFQGSTTAYVMEKAKVPVFSFPVDQPYKKIQHILYASDFNESDQHSIEKLLALTNHLHSRIHIVHLIKASSACSSDMKDYLKHQLNQHISSRFPTANIEVDVMNTDCPQKAIVQAIQKYNIQLLVTTTSNRRLEQRLNNPSFTKNLLYHIKIPMLAFHQVENAYSPNFYEDYY